MNIDPRYLQYLKKNQQLAIFVAVLVSVLMMMYAFIGYTPKYVSSSKVLVRESVLTSKYLTGEGIETTSSALTNPILNNMNLLKTEEISNAMWHYMQQYRPHLLKAKNIDSQEDWEAFFGDGSAFIKAKNIPGTDIIAINFTWDDPQVAKEGLITTLQGFQAASLKINQSEQIERSVYLAQQADDIRFKLGLVRGKIRDFKKKEKTVDVVQETENYARSRADFETALKVASAEAAAKHGEMNRYQSVLGMNARQALNATAIGGDPTMSKLHDQLYALKEEQAQNKSRYTDQHPRMKQLNSQIAQIESDIKNQTQRNLGSGAGSGKSQISVSDETRSGAIRNFVQAQSEATALSIKANQLNSYLKQLDQRMSSLPEIEATLSQYQDEENVLSSSLAMMEQKALEARIRGAQSLSNIYIVDSPRLPRGASFPTPVSVAFLGIFLGMAMGVAAVFLKMKLEETFNREFEVTVPNFGGLVDTLPLGLSKPQAPNRMQPSASPALRFFMKSE